MALVSIIVPVYNLENYIKRCLNSIINQTYKNIEIIVVNDGSTDNSLNIIKELSDLDDRIIIINTDHRGITAARICGYQRCVGEYILFVDGDDCIDIKAVERLYNTAKLRDYDIVQFKYLINYDNGEIGRVIIDNNKFINEDLLKLNLLGHTIFSIWSKFIKKEFIEKNHIKLPSNISYAEDVAITCVLSIYKPKFIFIDEYLYTYYRRDNSVSHTISNKLLDINKAMNYIKYYLYENNVYVKYKEEYEYLAYMQSFYYRRENIFIDSRELSKNLFKNWRSLKININSKNNRYYKYLYNNDGTKGRIIEYICQRYYSIGRLYYKFKNYKRGE